MVSRKAGALSSWMVVVAVIAIPHVMAPVLALMSIYVAAPVDESVTGSNR